MSFAETVLLGAIAGFTIYIGLPLARLERVASDGPAARPSHAPTLIAQDPRSRARRLLSD